MDEDIKQPCEFCGGEFKNLGSHQRFCKGKDRIVSVDTKKQEEHNETDEIIKVDDEITDDEIDTIDQEQTLDLKTEDSEHFFKNLKRWDVKKNQSLIQSVVNVFGKKQRSITCVFVSEDDDPRILEVPYNPKTQTLFNPETGEIYDMPTKGKFAFFHRDKFLPLVNHKYPHEDYDIPEHYALYLYNLGLGEGQLAAFDQLLIQINRWQLVTSIAVISAIAVTIGAILLTKQYVDGYESLSVQLNEMLTLIRGGA